MKVRITKANTDIAWYDDRIGEDFFVYKDLIHLPDNSMNYLCKDIKGRFIDADDCKVIESTVLTKIN